MPGAGFLWRSLAPSPWWTGGKSQRRHVQRVELELVGPFLIFFSIVTVGLAWPRVGDHGAPADIPPIPEIGFQPSSSKVKD